MMGNFIKTLLVSVSLFLAGCSAYVVVDKRPNIALPVYGKEDGSTNVVDYVIVDQGYRVKYSKCGLNTEIETMAVELTTNKTVKFSLGGLTSTVSTNNITLKIDDIMKVIELFRGTTNDFSEIKYVSDDNN